MTVVDDGTIPGGFGTSPFDAEGLPSRRTVIVEKGVLKNYVLNTYAGRKLGMKSTGNAGRGLAGNPYLDAGNLFLEAGSRAAEEIIRGVERGLYVTRMLGQGVNLVTGDYSRGAAGLWIENGELQFPVHEITIAGKFAGDAAEHHGDRERFGVSGRDGGAYTARGWDDHRGGVKAGYRVQGIGGGSTKGDARRRNRVEYRC